MKLFYNLLFTTILIFSCILLGNAQVTYVKTDASGGSDGTSWTNAYTDFQTALNSTTGGEIWLAAGTYVPTNVALDTFNTFLVATEVSIYGGFAGTESTKDDRIEGENTTTLSGDLMGDDIDNNFTTNKSDNVFHIMTIDAPVPSIIILDAITFTGGNTREDNTNSDYSWRGGAIYSYNTVDIADCNFNNNYARSGGSVYLSSEINGGAGSTFDNCVFEKNSTFSQSSAIYANTIANLTILNSTFQNNTTNRGTVYPFFCQDFIVDNCIFKDNIPTSSGNFGGAMFIWNSKGLVKDCTFDNNNTGNGAAVYMDGREELSPRADDVVFENCTFTNNAAIDFGGGAFRSFTASYTLKDCTFDNNSSANGGAIFSSGPDQQIVGDNNTFMNNTASFGGCQASYGINSNYSLSNNNYTGNAAISSGGALINGFGSSVKIDSCEFLSNIAGFGGAIFNQNDTTNVEIYNSSFIENSVSDGNGGAINISGPVMLTIDNCNFESNFAGFGGAINGTQGTVDVIEGFVRISNSIISLNTASTQGAGISLVDLDLIMTNTLVSTNFNTGSGAGGGLSLNTTANKSATFNITNSTIADNFAIIGGGIGAFSEDDNSQCAIFLRNNIFSNEGLNYEIEGGTPAAISLGGNISTDITLENILTGPGDFNESDDIMFVDASNNNFQLLDNSPAIDIGSAVGAPITDILGNPRIGAPDAGAYENQGLVGVEDIEIIDQLIMTPNPAHAFSTISFDNNWSGQIQISIIDMTGKVFSKSISQKNNHFFTKRLPTDQLDAGSYILSIQSNGKKISTSFIKI